MRGLPKVIGQGIYMRESSARSRSMQGVASRQIERERESARGTGVYVCAAAAAATLQCENEGEREQ